MMVYLQTQIENHPENVEKALKDGFLDISHVALMDNATCKLDKGAFIRATPFKLRT